MGKGGEALTTRVLTGGGREGNLLLQSANGPPAPPALVLPLELELSRHGSAQKSLRVLYSHRQITRNGKYNKYQDNN